MANINITNVDLGTVILGDAEHRDDTFTAAGAVTLKDGTILARNSSTGKLILYVKGGETNGNGTPKAVVTLTDDMVIASAGDVPVRPLVAGKVRKDRLIIAADGDASNVDDTVIDLLRDYGIVAIDAQEMSIQDNQ